ncbi:MAG TPA: aminotransferase class III-fold pyridoxal phosphate-dependent enzyme, partial [Polyangiaceae bacterium]
YGGREDAMNRVAPLGPVYQAGTLSGNPLAVSAGLATLEQLVPSLYEKLEHTSAALERGLSRVAADAGATVRVQRVGSMLTVFFRAEPVKNWTDAAACDTRQFATWHAALLSRGVYWPPSQFEAAFVGAAHSALDVEQTVEAAANAFALVK